MIDVDAYNDSSLYKENYYYKRSNERGGKTKKNHECIGNKNLAKKALRFLNLRAHRRHQNNVLLVPNPLPHNRGEKRYVYLPGLIPLFFPLSITRKKGKKKGKKFIQKLECQYPHFRAPAPASQRPD